MKKNNKGAARAKELLEEIGAEELKNISLEMVATYLGITVLEESMNNADGRIVRGKTKTLVKINKDIPYPEKKRFVLAHEIGHFLLHDRLEIHGDTDNTLNWFQHTEARAIRGDQEAEANDFAAELLMPEAAFRKQCYRIPFSQNLIKNLSVHFNTSLTSVIYRCYSLNIHPLFIASMHNGKVLYYLKSHDLHVWVKNLTKLAPPEDSIAMEYIEANYDFIYKDSEKTQQIEKSTWFELGKYDKDYPFYEYCIPVKTHKTVLSVVWEA